MKKRKSLSEYFRDRAGGLLHLKGGSDTLEADGYRLRLYTYRVIDTDATFITANFLRNTAPYTDIRLLMKRALWQYE